MEVHAPPLTEPVSGKRLRLRRLMRHSSKLFLVPMDHSVTDGPIGQRGCVDQLVGIAAAGGADAVVLHKGRLREVAAEKFDCFGLMVHLSASTSRSADPNEKVLVASVEEALGWGADAVSVHVNVGSATETAQLAGLAAVAEACARWGLPLLAMMYARGPAITNPHGADLIAHLAAIAVDLGADIVKTDYTGDASSMADVVATCPIPIVAAGGPVVDSLPELVAFAESAMRSGVAGLAVGRNVFRSAHPDRVVRALAAVIHGPAAGVGPQMSVQRLRPLTRRTAGLREVVSA